MHLRRMAKGLLLLQQRRGLMLPAEEESPNLPSGRRSRRVDLRLHPPKQEAVRR